MFKQITNLNGDEGYLIFTLLMFVAFFILVTVLLIRMKKDHVQYMGGLPLTDKAGSPDQDTNQNR